jgi:S1-C subfamily serine protease
MARRLGLVALLAAAVSGLWGCAPVQASPLTAEELLAMATVTVGGRCAGVVAEGGLHVVTAAHCLMDHEDAVPLALFDGTPALGVVAHVDRESDVAVLFLQSPVAVEGLAFADALPEPGTEGFFAGRFDRGATMQAIRVLRLGPCPSLPGVPQALFTSLRGIPGDSGAPVVDGRLQVMGLVHGGAQCSIAAPTHEVPSLLELLPPQ